MGVGLRQTQLCVDRFLQHRNRGNANAITGCVEIGDGGGDLFKEGLLEGRRVLMIEQAKYSIVEKRQDTEVTLRGDVTLAEAAEFVSRYDPEGTIPLFLRDGDHRIPLQGVSRFEDGESVEWKEEGF